MKIAFIRPPRHFWPILNESDNFLVPLAYPTLAAYLRRHLDDIEILLLDCCVEEIGYASLRRWLQSHRPDVVCIGEKVPYAHEALRTFKLVRELLPDVVNVAGGQFFTHQVEYSLTQCKEIDFVVRYEGEETLAELLKTLRSGGELSEVRGIAYLVGDDVVTTSPRPLIEDLDTLPFPAYDLAGVERYSPFGKLWPKATTVQRGRGCSDTCKFCSWWVQEAEQRWDGCKWVPVGRYRTKSPLRMVDEIAWLYKDFGIRYLFWVDGTWNLDDDWLDVFCSEIIKRRYRLGWWAFFRVDRVREQHENGTLARMVEAGLRHVLVGVERAQTGEIAALDKRNYTRSRTVEAFGILARHYPQVFRQGTILTGLPDDTEASIKALVDYALECNLDFAAFHPLTPFPGTPLYEEMLSSPLLEERDFRKFDMFLPVLRTKHLTREQVAEHTTWCYQNFVGKRPLRFARRLFSPHTVRRRLHWWFSFAIARIMAQDAIKSARGEKSFEGFAGVNTLWKPSWYDE